MARAHEALGGRWTLLIVREILCGSRRFNDIRRGIPRVSRTVLSERLQALVLAGALTRVDATHGPEYALTEAGQELATLVSALGTWGTALAGAGGGRGGPRSGTAAVRYAAAGALFGLAQGPLGGAVRNSRSSSSASCCSRRPKLRFVTRTRGSPSPSVCEDRSPPSSPGGVATCASSRLKDWG
jgi:DNA-binding HxlR family transcriptional regulator